MGKGVGKLHLWFTNIKPGSTLLEFNNLRPGRSKYFSKQISYKLPVSVVYIEKKSTLFKINGAYSTNVFLTPFVKF